MITKVLSFGIMSFLARVLNPTGIGVYSAILTSAASVNQICDLGTTVVLQRSGARINEIGPQAAGYRFTFIFLLQVVLNTLVSICIYFFPDFFNKSLLFNIGESSYIQSIGIIALFQILSQVPLTFLLGLGEFKTFAIRTMLGNLIILLCTVIYVIVFNSGIQQVINASIVAWVLNTVYTLYILNRIFIRYQIPFSLKNLANETTAIFKEGFVYYLGNTFTGALYNIIMLSLFSKYIGIGEYGFVRMAAAMVAILGILPAALQPVTMTFLASGSAQESQLKSLQLRYIAIFSFIATVAIIFLMEVAIRVLFGNQYVIGKPIFIFMTLMNMVILLSSLISNFLVAKGHATYIGVVSLGCAMLNILACIVLIPKYGLPGFFIAYLLGYGLGFLFVLYKEFRDYSYPDIYNLIKLGYFFLFAFVTILPVLFINNVYVEWTYKGVYFSSILLIGIPLSIYAGEKQKIFLLLKSNPFNWLRKNPMT